MMSKARYLRWNSVYALALLISAPAMAQKWELGAGGGASFYSNKTVENRNGSADTGFSNGYTATAWLGQNSYKYVGGEIRYQFAKNDLKLSSGGTKVGFSAQTHTVGYNVLIHTRTRESKLRPYVLFGGGVKIYSGVGEPHAAQPLAQFAALTKTNQPKPYVQFGGGIKYMVGEHLFIRAEVTDQMSPFPDDVILPIPAGSLSGWIHNILPVFGIGLTF